MLNKIDPVSLSKALFNIDPCNTCCVENEAFDEYDNVASEVAEDIANFPSANLNNAIPLVIEEYFDIDLSAEVVSNVVEEYMVVYTNSH